VYDDARASVAARLWWMLDATGHEAAVLDGGLDAWDRPRETGPVSERTPGSFSPRPWPAVADADDVAAALRDGSTVVLDSRAVERFRGDVEPYDPVAGHIPGARSAAWAGSLDEGGRFLAPAALRKRFAALGATEGTSTIAHCGSGVTACHTVLALRLACLGEATLYEGSWSDWVSDPTRPVARGPE
jgi:thiosulfate/3-mercaptopyruvate sulfurtransferase